MTDADDDTAVIGRNRFSWAVNDGHANSHHRDEISRNATHTSAELFWVGATAAPDCPGSEKGTLNIFRKLFASQQRLNDGLDILENLDYRDYEGSFTCGW